MRLLLVLLLALGACGEPNTPPASSPVVGLTANPPGEVVDVAAHPELVARCALTIDGAPPRTTSGMECLCNTQCPEGLVGKDGACVQTFTSTVFVFFGGACRKDPAEIDREHGCEVPDWPLVRCDVGAWDK